jgi:hypothetical protein
MKCTGTTKRDTPCKAPALNGTDRCGRHPRVDTRVDSSRAGEGRWDRVAFLEAFESEGMVSKACQVIGVSRQAVYAERQRNEEFAVAWADVEERVVETMEREAYRRAVEGTTKPLVSAGKHVTDVTEYSDSLLQFLLKARRPERYRENVKVEHSGGVTQRVQVDLSKLSADELAALEGIAAKLED